MDANLEMRGLRRKMKWQRWERGVQQHSYKALPPPFTFDGFWETAPRFVPLRILCNSVAGCYLGFRATIARIAHLSPQFVTAHRIFADFSAICYGSVITTVQPLLRFFLHGSISPIFPLVARGLRHHYDLFPHHTGDFLLLTISDPGTM